MWFYFYNLVHDIQGMTLYVGKFVSTTNKQMYHVLDDRDFLPACIHKILIWIITNNLFGINFELLMICYHSQDMNHLYIYNP